MKPSRKRKPKVAELQTEQNVTSVCTAVKKSVKRPSGRRCNAIGNVFYLGTAYVLCILYM